MKIINTKAPLIANQLFDYFKQHLNALFKQRRQSDLEFDLELQGDVIEIYNRELYEGYLFSIKVEGTAIAITISEHYVDDINAITLDSIMYNLLRDYPGDEVKQEYIEP